MLASALCPHKFLFLSLLIVIVATETGVSAGFSIGSSPRAGRHVRDRRAFCQSVNHRTNLSQRSHGQSAAVIRRGGRRDDKDTDAEELEDFGGAVGGLFGNFRIPAMLVAASTLGSAFALPFAETDRVLFGFSKRIYAFTMLTSLGSMVLVVILSTICMNDIAISPARLSTSVQQYIDDNYALEWMMVKSHFYYGTLAFVVGTAFRAWVSITCPVVGNAIVGILSSLTVISISTLLEKSRNQGGGKPFRQNVVCYLKLLLAKGKSSPLFGAGAILWATTVAYIFVKFPHVYLYLSGV
uniref:Uncharacterized protein n=1 Tax=Ditylum brightwellii TaxID=49249 RepID=A0A7S4STU6_9STRA|mmetsp:Transcript_55074/g.81961  ORF Transcript_55074/g.81961 Transcript_55074/m.81961 type:complete len:297 (+) Transcript_55074:127-1017(+)